MVDILDASFFQIIGHHAGSCIEIGESVIHVAHIITLLIIINILLGVIDDIHTTGSKLETVWQLHVQC